MHGMAELFESARGGGVVLWSPCFLDNLGY